MSDTFLFAILARLPEPVLSAYLNTNRLHYTNQPSGSSYLSWFHSQARQLVADCSISDRSDLSSQINRVERFLEHWPQEHRGLALFAGADAWQAIPLETEPVNELHWGKPMLWQLREISEKDLASCIVVVNMSGVHVFRCRYGRLTPLDSEQFQLDASQFKQMLGSHAAERSAGMSHGPQRDLYRRRRESHYRQFLSEITQRLTRVCEDQRPSWILLIGSLRYTRIIQSKLNSSLRSRVLQAPHAFQPEDDMRSFHTSIEDILHHAESTRKEQRVEELLMRSSGIVTGAEETLAELQRGRVASLIVCDDFNPVLRYCSGCGHLAASSLRECEHCNRNRSDVGLHEILPQFAILHSCDLELAHGAAAERLRNAGSIGGWLRSRSLAGLSTPLQAEVEALGCR